MLGMMPQRKKIASLIMAESPGIKKPEVQADGSMAMEVVAEKFLAAVKSEDKGMLAAALKEAIQICSDEHEMQEQE
jgi:hypothetical protein